MTLRILTSDGRVDASNVCTLFCENLSLVFLVFLLKRMIRIRSTGKVHTLLFFMYLRKETYKDTILHSNNNNNTAAILSLRLSESSEPFKDIFPHEVRSVLSCLVDAPPERVSLASIKLLLDAGYKCTMINVKCSTVAALLIQYIVRFNLSDIVLSAVNNRATVVAVLMTFSNITTCDTTSFGTNKWQQRFPVHSFKRNTLKFSVTK